MNSKPVEVTVNNHMNNSSLPLLDTQSLSSHEDATERTPTPRVSRHSHKDANSRVEEVYSDEGSEEGSDYNSSDYETDSTGSENSYIDINSNPMYQVMSAFLENNSLENRMNVTEAIIELKSSVDRVADMLEKLVTRNSSIL